jgi:[amino group carrier protein]-lysine/ornithine hydrolase
VDSTELLEGLVRINSPSMQEREAASYLVAKMNSFGFRAFLDEAGNAVGVLGSGGRDIVLLGHIDTFAGEIPVRIEDRNLYGRGSVDAKGCLAAFVSACARVGAREDLRLVVIGAVEEECATSKGARYAVNQYRPEFCIIGEPSGWDRVTLGYKGRVLVDYYLERPMTHTASSAQAATEQAVEFWNQISAFSASYNRDKTGVTSKLDPSLRYVRTDEDPFLDRVLMRIGIRIPIGLSINQVEEEVARFSDGAKVAFSSREEPFRADKNNALVRAFLGAIRAEGGKPAFTLKTGTSDMNIAGPAWGCPIVAYGPGDSALDHTPTEHLDLDEYENAINILARVLIGIF